MKTEKLVYFHEEAMLLLERSSIQVGAAVSYSELDERKPWGVAVEVLSENTQ